MAQQQGLRLRIRIEGGREILAGFRALPREASQQLRERTLLLSQELAQKVQQGARGDSPQSALLAPTVKARKDRVPSIQAGGTKKVGSNRAPAFKLLFGSEFGANELKQFRPHTGQGSYWFFKTVERHEAEIATAWRELAREITESFSDGGV